MQNYELNWAVILNKTHYSYVALTRFHTGLFSTKNRMGKNKKSSMEAKMSVLTAAPHQIWKKNLIFQEALSVCETNYATRYKTNDPFIRSFRLSSMLIKRTMIFRGFFYLQLVYMNCAVESAVGTPAKTKGRSGSRSII